MIRKMFSIFAIILGVLTLATAFMSIRYIGNIGGIWLIILTSCVIAGSLIE